MEALHNTISAAALLHRGLSLVPQRFHADAVVHFGRHGTLEFLPVRTSGRPAGTARSHPGDLPNAYYYIMDGGGESTTARGAARRHH